MDFPVKATQLGSLSLSCGAQLSVFSGLCGSNEVINTPQGDPKVTTLSEAVTSW